MIPDSNTVVIEAVSPEIDLGRAPVKRVVGQRLVVEADIFSHGHAVVGAVLRHREHDETEWRETPMAQVANDRWRGSFRLERNTRYLYTVFAWRDPFLSWLEEIRKKHVAGMDLTSDLQAGCIRLERTLASVAGADRDRLEGFIAQLVEPDEAKSGLEQAVDLAESSLERARHGDAVVTELERLLTVLRGVKRLRGSTQRRALAEVLFDPELELLMARSPDRSDCGQYPRELEVIVDRPAAEYSAWYEMWHRSQGTDPERSATFAEMEQRLPEIREMGFDVIYLPPIHPVGRTHRKGPNNSLACPPGSPGCPYAIGNEHGGHTAIEPSLGTLEQFRHFERACRERGMEIALDFALQASPDHPWVAEHPEWFEHRPDGSIKHAENPPKKYEDIYPLDFGTEDREGLWQACLGVLRFWVEQGVKIFRVDNPHTKPVQFWQWLIAEIQRTDPDVLFLAEAFTRPKMMKALGKAGFSQSYTYFTWRNFKHELIEYFTELTSPPTSDIMRGNLFTNTPDILPRILQNAPRSAFMMRATLAATLSSVWGMYNGFELGEGTPRPDSEEYLDSEKYQLKVWDWDRPGNIKDYIGRLNRIRDEQPALQQYRALRFFPTDDDNLLAYGKATEDLSNVIIVVVNLDPYKPHEGTVELPLAALDLRPDETYQLHDLLGDKRYFWRGAHNFVRLDPASEVGHVFRLLRWSHREQDFDYFI